MRFNDNQVDFYDGFCEVNGMFLTHISKITIGLSDIYFYRRNDIICSMPIDNLKECYVEESLNDGYSAEEERYITKWIKKQHKLILKELVENVEIINKIRRK